MSDESGYGVRECRGHWHVTHGDEDLALPGDPFASEAEACEAMYVAKDLDALRYAASQSFLAFEASLPGNNLHCPTCGGRTNATDSLAGASVLAVDRSRSSPHAVTPPAVFPEAAPPRATTPEPQWERAIRPWNEYPEGTEARDSTGCRWTKTAQGWKADDGVERWPYPGAAYEVRVPLAGSPSLESGALLDALEMAALRAEVEERRNNANASAEAHAGATDEAEWNRARDFWFDVHDALRDAARMREALEWALGEGDEFQPRAEGEGAYWWRTEMRRRAGIGE